MWAAFAEADWVTQYKGKMGSSYPKKLHSLQRQSFCIFYHLERSPDLDITSNVDFMT